MSGRRAAPHGSSSWPTACSPTSILAAAELQVAARTRASTADDVFFVLKRVAPSSKHGRRASSRVVTPTLFALRDLRKDVDLAMALFGSSDARIPLIQSASVHVGAAAAATPDLDISAVALPYRQIDSSSAETGLARRRLRVGRLPGRPADPARVGLLDPADEHEPHGAGQPEGPLPVRRGHRGSTGRARWPGPRGQRAVSLRSRVARHPGSIRSGASTRPTCSFSDPDGNDWLVQEVGAS